MKKYAQLFEEDCKYYDPKKVELRTLLRLVDFKNKEVLDAGCGTARLTIPISKFAESVIAIDKDRRLVSYCKHNKERKNIKYGWLDINKIKFKKRFDIILISWLLFKDPEKVFKKVAVALKDKGSFIFILPFIGVGYEKPDLLFSQKQIKKDTAAWKRNKNSIKKIFNVKKKVMIKTFYAYPTVQKAYQLALLFEPSLKKMKNKIMGNLEKEKKKGKVIINTKAEIYVCFKKF